MLETALNLAGLLLTAGGAFVAAHAVIITDKQAELLSGTYFDGNEAMRDALMKQSRSARNGLMCVVAGTVLQAAALVIPIFTPGQAHTQESASMALGICKMEVSKNANAGAGFLTDCMASKGFLFDYREGCMQGAIFNNYTAECFRAEERPGLIGRIRHTLGFAE